MKDKLNKNVDSEQVSPNDEKLLLGEEISRYYIRFRNISPEMMFTPIYLISIDHIQVDAKKDATEWDLKIAICRELDNLNYRPDDIRIESSQPFA